MDTILALTTAGSVLVALAMTAVAFRLVRDERRRAAARIAALEAQLAGGLALDPPGSGVPAAPAAASRVEPPATTPDAISTLDPNAPISLAPAFFGTTDATPPRRRSLIGAVAALALAGAAVALLTTSGSDSETASRPIEDTPSLELLSLDYVRTGSTWSITGLVRNRESSRDLNGVTAVAVLFDRQGALLATGSAAIDTALAPGSPTPFAVTLTNDRDVARYRVSFRAADGRALRHVDSRGTGVPAAHVARDTGQ